MAEDVRRFHQPSDRMLYGKAPAIADTAVTDEILRTRNVFVIGGPRENALAARLMARMPVREADGALRMFDAEAIPLDGRGYLFVYPNPEFPARLAVFYGSAMPRFYSDRRSDLLGWMAPDLGAMSPDMLVNEVATKESPRAGNRTVRSAYFTNDCDSHPGPPER